MKFTLWMTFCVLQPWVGKFWAQFTRVTVMPKFTNTDIINPSDGLYTWLELHLMWNVEFEWSWMAFCVSVPMIWDILAQFAWLAPSNPRVFPTRGMSGAPPTSQKFAHPPLTRKIPPSRPPPPNFYSFPTKIQSPPLNKNFQVIA